MDNVFDIKGLTFSYGSEQVIKGLDLSLKEGKVTTLIGANGCGKSTLFNLITKNLKPQGGSIMLGGREVSQIKLKDFAKQVAIVHQYNTAPAEISVEKLVAFGSIANSEEDEQKIKRALEITNTEKLKGKAVAQLSGGQKQRVWIAMALAQDTRILFLDEPTTYLDIRYQLQILKLVRRLNEEYGMTVVMVLHDINQSLYYSDEIVAMKDGRITAQGKPEEIISSELIEEVYGV